MLSFRHLVPARRPPCCCRVQIGPWFGRGVPQQRSDRAAAGGRLFRAATEHTNAGRRLTLYSNHYERPIRRRFCGLVSGRRRNGAPSESWAVRKDQHVLSCGTDREPRFGDCERAPTNAHGRRGARVLGLWSAEVGPACRIAAKEEECGQVFVKWLKLETI